MIAGVVWVQQLVRYSSGGGTADCEELVKVSDLVEADARSRKNRNQVPIPKLLVKRD